MQLDREPRKIGTDVLRIWNARVESLRNKFSHLRTVVLIKSNELTKLAVFEVETILFPTDRFTWSRNSNGNLVAHDKAGMHRFTWQPHGSQFTIIEDVPKECLLIEVKPPEKLDKNSVLEAVEFDGTWVKVISRS